MKNQFRMILLVMLFFSLAFYFNPAKSSENFSKEKMDSHALLANHGSGGAANPGSKHTGFEGLKEINGAKIFCKVIGTGEALVIVHGGPGLAHDYLYEPFQQLADKYKLIFYDQRGCGRSAEFNAKDSVTMHDLVSDLEGVRQAFKIERMNLVGQSWGAIISINYLAKYPDHVRKLLLLEPAPGSTDYLADFQKTIMQRLSQPDKERLAQLSQDSGLRKDPQLFHEFMRIRFKAYSLDTLFLQEMHIDYFDSLRIRKFFTSSAAFAPYLLKFDLYEDLKNIACPTLIIHGEFDPIPTASIERMAAAIPHSELHVIEGSGHFVHIEKPDVYFGLIRAFLKKD